MSRLNLLQPHISIGGTVNGVLVARGAEIIGGNLKMLRLTVKKGFGPGRVRKVQDWQEER